MILLSLALMLTGAALVVFSLALLAWTTWISKRPEPQWVARVGLHTSGGGFVLYFVGVALAALTT